MKKSKKQKVIIANDHDNNVQPQTFIAAAGYGKDRNYLDRDPDSGQVSSTKKNNRKMAPEAAKKLKLDNLKVGLLIAVAATLVVTSCKPSIDPAIETLKKSAEQDDSSAQYKLAQAYEHGEGVEKNYESAGEWYRDASTHGVNEARVRLQRATDACHSSDMSHDAINEKQANECQIAAEGGDRYAQYTVGILHDSGRYLHQDSQLAAAWFFQAAIQGDGNAQAMLARAFSGKGLPKNAVEEYAWITVSAQNTSTDPTMRKLGNVGKEAILELIKKHENEVEFQQAQKKAQEYISKYGALH